MTDTYRSTRCHVCTLTKLCARCRQCGDWACEDHTNTDGLCDECARAGEEMREEGLNDDNQTT